jgi:hypothetical protein
MANSQQTFKVKSTSWQIKGSDPAPLGSPISDKQTIQVIVS